MKTRTAALVILALGAASLLYALVLYPALPERLPTHWNAAGQVDGWSSKRWAAFLGPGFCLLSLLMLYGLPWLSPRNFSVENFRETFNYVIVVLAAMLAFVGVVSLQAGLRPGLDMGRVLVGGILLFFALIGNVLGKVRRNFWMGVRTPWTLANDAVWIATHRLAARLFTGAGLLGAIAIWLGAPILWVGIAFITAALLPVPYSLLVYKRLEREGRLGPNGAAAA